MKNLTCKLMVVGTLFCSLDLVANQVRYKYDEYGQIKKLIMTKGNVTKFKYSDAGNLIERTNALGHTFQILAYSKYNLPSKVKDENGVITQYEYNARGLLEKSITANRTTTYLYNALNQLISIKQPSGSTTRYEYNESTQLKSIINDRGESINYIYDAMGNVVATHVKDSEGSLVSSVYTERDDLGTLPFSSYQNIV